jgi:hypothetical protein
MKQIATRFYRWYMKGQCEGTNTDNMKQLPKARFYLGSIFEQTIYNIVGHDKFLRWQWLHDFFERWH